MTTQLKPCPWCGDTPRQDNIGRKPKNDDKVPEFWFWVYCGNCGCHGPLESTEPRAREAWNARQA